MTDSIELSPLATKLYNTFLRWQKRHTRATGEEYFTASSSYLKKQFGDYYAVAMRELRSAHLLSVVSAERFKAGKKGNGHCRGYRAHTDGASQLNFPDVMTYDFSSTEAQEYLAVRARTNLTSNPTFLAGRENDTRVYTDVSQMSKKLLKDLTIDGEAVVELDIGTAFPIFVGRALQSRGIEIEPEYLSLCERGQLYDVLAEIADVPRAMAKHAVSKIMNAPGNLRFGRIENIGGRVYTIPSFEDKQQRLVAQVFKLAFPKTYDALRKLARGRLSYFIGAKYETKIRKFVTEYANNAGIPILTRHDGTVVKQSDASAMWDAYGRAMEKFGAFKLSEKQCGQQVTYMKPLSSSPLICGVESFDQSDGDSGGGMWEFFTFSST